MTIPRNHRITFRVTRREHQHLAGEARQRGITLTALLRAALCAYLSPDLFTPPNDDERRGDGARLDDTPQKKEQIHEQFYNN